MMLRLAEPTERMNRKCPPQYRSMPASPHSARKRRAPRTSCISITLAHRSLPQPVLDAVFDHLTLEATIGGYEAAALANDRLEGVYASIARLLNASPDEIALVENATRCWDMAVYAIPFAPGDRILTSKSEYASNLVAMIQIAERHDVTIDVIPNDEHGQISLDALATALRQPVRAVFVGYIPTNDGLVQPIEEIGALIREDRPECWYVVDACQSAGQIPLDVERIQCDILSATSRKYLRGPRGVGFVYIRRSRIDTMEPPPRVRSTVRRSSTGDRAW